MTAQKIKGKWYQAENTRVIIEQSEHLDHVKGYMAAKVSDLKDVLRVCEAVNNYEDSIATLNKILEIEKYADSLRGSGMVDDSDQKALRAMANQVRALLRRIEEGK